MVEHESPKTNDPRTTAKAITLMIRATISSIPTTPKHTTKNKNENEKFPKSIQNTHLTIPAMMDAVYKNVFMHT